MPCSYSQHWYFFLTDASAKKNFAAEAVSNIPRSQCCQEEEGRKEGQASKEGKDGKRARKRAHDSQRNSISQIYFDNP